MMSKILLAVSKPFAASVSASPHEYSNSNTNDFKTLVEIQETYCAKVEISAIRIAVQRGTFWIVLVLTQAILILCFVQTHRKRGK